jgi:hypothetical protein
VFALQALRTGDKVKGWLYALLAGLLFFVGGSMLLLQLISSVSGLDEASINPSVLYGLFLLRVIVSAGMVALSCTKHIRFSGQETAETFGQVDTSALDKMLEQIRIELADLRAIKQALTTQTVVSEETSQQPALPAPEGEQEANTAKPARGGEDQDEQATNNNAERVKAYLADHPNAKVREVSQALTMSLSTASKWMMKARTEP